MKTPGVSPIGELLSEIRDLYGTLVTMTKGFLDEFSIPALQNLLNERAAVLLKIESEEDRLLRISEVESLKFHPEYGEITRHISTIASCDREITARVVQGMNTVKRELSTLSATSNAAIRYTRHARG